MCKILFLPILFAFSVNLSVADIASDVRVEFYLNDNKVLWPQDVSAVGSSMHTEVHTESKDDLNSVSDFLKSLLIETLKDRLII